MILLLHLIARPYEWHRHGDIALASTELRPALLSVVFLTPQLFLHLSVFVHGVLAGNPASVVETVPGPFAAVVAVVAACSSLAAAVVLVGCATSGVVAPVGAAAVALAVPPASAPIGLLPPSAALTGLSPGYKFQPWVPTSR